MIASLLLFALPAQMAAEEKTSEAETTETMSEMALEVKTNPLVAKTAIFIPSSFFIFELLII